MVAEQVILILLQMALFTSVLTLGFKSTLAEPFFLFRRPRLLIRTFLAMYVVVPIVTIFIIALIQLPTSTKIGLILLSISPVATASPHKMFSLGANPPYVYSLLISLSLFAVITMPLSLAILTALPLVHDANIHPLQVAKLIAQTVLLPLVIGVIIHRLAPRWTDLFGELINNISGKVLITSLFILMILNFEGIIEIGILSLSIILILAAVALGVGHSLGGPILGDRAALALAASQRQIAIAALIAAINFPGSVTVAVIVSYLIISMLETILYTKWCRKQLLKQAKP